MQVNVCWKSKIDPKVLQRHDNFVVDEALPYHVALLDAGYFPSQNQFEADLVSAALKPKLIIVDGPETEFSLINRRLATPLDEFCYSDRVEVELIPRLKRLLERADSRRLWNAVDSLTGLMNRQSLLEHGRPLLISVSQERPLSVLLIDIDHFKRINDERGHQAGDKILRAIADVLTQRAQGVECVARYGGEEFAILSSVSMDQAAGLAEFVRQEVEQTKFEDGMRVTISIGVDTIFEPIPEAELWQGADRCLYKAKAEGRNRVVTSVDLQDSEEGSPDADFHDFETRMRVISERFGEELALRGKRMAKRYREEAERDGLTGLYNRRYLDKRLPREIENAIKHERKLSFIMLDLDHFGEVNHTYGWPGGDRALKLVASALRNNTRIVDWVARYGGEEFCVVMPDTPLDGSLAIAERLRIAIKSENTRAVDGREINITASLGVVEVDGARGKMFADTVALIQAASDTVREAKNGGRDRVCIWRRIHDEKE
jgi:two-component system, cell cycle response regulator